MDEVMYVFLLIVLPLLIAIAVSLRYERLRPLLVGLAIVFISFPLYYVVSRLPLSFELRILLQVVIFAALLGLTLYLILLHAARLRGAVHAR